VPRELTTGPFTLDDARRFGLTRAHLRGLSWRRLARGTYAWTGLEDSPLHDLHAARRRLPAESAFSGLTAAWLHGIDVAPCSPIEVTVGIRAGISARAGILLRRSKLAREDVTCIGGLCATSLVRTLAELCGRLNLVEAVVLADAALHSRRVSLKQLKSWAGSHSARPGIRRLRRVISDAEPASESPMESRLRMLLVHAGLPRPRAQVSIHDRWGRFAGRPDLYYESHRLGLEYDGGVHRDALVDDNRRQNRLLRAGVTLLRFTAADVLGNPGAVVFVVFKLLEARPGLAPIAGKSAIGRHGNAPSAGTRLK